MVGKNIVKRKVEVLLLLIYLSFPATRIPNYQNPNVDQLYTVFLNFLRRVLDLCVTSRNVFTSLGTVCSILSWFMGFLTPTPTILCA